MQISQFISRCQQRSFAALWAWQLSIPNALSMSVLPLHTQWGRSTFTYVCMRVRVWGHNRRHFSGTHTHRQTVYTYLCVFVCCNAVDIQIVTVCLTHTYNVPVSFPCPPFPASSCHLPFSIPCALTAYVLISLALSLCFTQSLSLPLSLFYSSCVCVCVFA